MTIDTNPATETQAKAKFDKRNLTQRFFTALISAAFVVVMIVWDSWGLAFICVLLTTAGLLEFFKLVGVKRRAPYTVTSLIVAGLVWVLILLEYEFGMHTGGYYPLVLLALPVILIVMLYRPELESSFATMGYLMLGWTYVMLPYILLYVLGHNPKPGVTHAYNWQIPFGVLFTIWGCDVAAYFAGKFFGRHKLFPRISPGKTWEGFAGAFVFSIGFGLLLNYALTTTLYWPVVGLIVVTIGSYGDLVESMLKRNLGLKDSGGIFPGHGGVLDRFDSFLLAMPIIFLYVYYGL